jgi:glycosyltransferase involved in cell wall biosynthesis
VHEAYRRTIDEITRSFHVDVIHLHGVDFFEYAPSPGPAVVVTLHLPPSFYPAEVFALSRPRTHWVCVSESQRRALPGTELPLWSIENGVNLVDLRPRADKGDYVVALGRICPEKGFHLAVEAAKMAGCDLLLGGELFPYRDHRRYFDDVLAPRLDERRRFLGPLGRAKKAELLARARALAVPSLVPETSSLAAMEALGSGTPVVAHDVGALPHIVEHGKTGFIVSGVPEMAAAFALVHDIDPSVCRRAAEARFGVDRMTREYLELYARVAAEPS